MIRALILLSFLSLISISCKKENELAEESKFAQEVGYSVSMLETQIPSLLAYSLHKENLLFPVYFNPVFLDSLTNDGDGIEWSVETKNYLERRDLLKTRGRSLFYGTSRTGLQQDTVKLTWTKADSFFVQSDLGKNQLIGQLALIHQGGLNYSIKCDLQIVGPEKISNLTGNLSLKINPENFDLNFLSGREYNGSLLYTCPGERYLVDLEENIQVNESNTLANTGLINIYREAEYLGRLELDPFSNKAWDFVARFKNDNSERIMNCW